MNQFVLLTLIDIGLDQDRNANQKKNYESLIQTLQLRTQIEPIITVKQKFDESMPFKLSNRDPVWSMIFRVETPEYYGTQLELVNSDLNYVPCILGLGESRKVKEPFFLTDPSFRNTFVIKQQIFKELESINN